VAEGCCEKEKRRALLVRANSIFDCLASRHSRLRQGSKIDYSSITLRLVSSSVPPSRIQRIFLSPSSSLLPLFSVTTCIVPASTSLCLTLSTPRSVGPIGPEAPIPSPSSSGPVLSSLSLLRYRGPISRLHVACPNDVSERTGTTAI